MPPPSDYPLNPICKAWLEKISLAGKFKKTEFGNDAEEAMNFFDGPYTQFWKDEYATGDRGYRSREGSIVPPKYRMNMNRVAEAVQLFGPTLYPKNPTRTATARIPRMPSPQSFGIDVRDPNAQMYMQQIQFQFHQMATTKQDSALAIQEYLNYTPNEFDLESHVRRCIVETIIKGASCLWTEQQNSHGINSNLVGSFYDSIDNVVLDHDADLEEDILWIARKCVHSRDQLEQEYGLKPGTLEKSGHYESISKQAELDSDASSKAKRREGRSKDLIRYWKVYSKTGMGHRFVTSDRLKDTYGPVLDQLGDYCYLVLADGIPYPLNMPPPEFSLEPQDEQQMFMAAQWPIPFWADNQWPCEILSFHSKPGSIYPISIIKPGLGELKFLNIAMSFLADKIGSHPTMLGVFKGAAADVRSQIEEAMKGFGVIEIDDVMGKSIRDIMSYIDPPEIQESWWRIIAAVMEQFERRVGLSPLLYGMQATQDRSAATSQIKQSNVNVRIDDMFRKVSRSLTRIARKEAFGARWISQPEDLTPVIGPALTQVWQNTLMSADIETMVREYDYRVESGSAREPTKETKVAQANEAFQVIGPIAQFAASMGQVQLTNALTAKWWEANDYEGEPPALQPPPPPPQQAPPQQQGPPPQ